MVVILVNAISGFAGIIEIMLLARALLSWFLQSGNPTVYKVYTFLVSLTEIVVAPCRFLLQKLNFGGTMFDFSVFLAFFLVRIIESLLIRVIILIF